MKTTTSLNWEWNETVKDEPLVECELCSAPSDMIDEGICILCRIEMGKDILFMREMKGEHQSYE